MTNKTEHSAIDAIKTQIAQLQAELDTLEAANAIEQKYVGTERRAIARNDKTPTPEKIGRPNDPGYGELVRNVRKAVRTMSGKITFKEVLNTLKTLKLSQDAAPSSVTGVLKKLARPGGPLKVTRKGKGSLPTVFKIREDFVWENL